MRRQLGRDAEVRNVELGIDGARECVDRRHLGEKRADHLRRHLAWIRAHALGGDPVVARTDEYRATFVVARKQRLAGDRRELFGERFDAPQTVQRLGKLVDPFARRLRRTRVGWSDGR